jgi:hypothetical protein
MLEALAKNFAKGFSAASYYPRVGVPVPPDVVFQDESLE